MLRFERQNIAPTSLSDERFLKHSRAARVSKISIHAIHQARMGDFQFRANLLQVRRGTVEHFTTIVDGFIDQVDQTVSVR